MKPRILIVEDERRLGEAVEVRLEFIDRIAPEKSGPRAAT